MEPVKQQQTTPEKQQRVSEKKRPALGSKESRIAKYQCSRHVPLLRRNRANLSVGNQPELVLPVSCTCRNLFPFAR